MKTINKILAVPLIALGIGSCATLPRTSTPPEYAGRLESVQPMDRNKLVETNQGLYPLKKYPKIQVGQDCYLIFERGHSGAFVPYLTTMEEFASKKTGKKYRIQGRKRAF